MNLRMLFKQSFTEVHTPYAMVLALIIALSTCFLNPSAPTAFHDQVWSQYLPGEPGLVAGVNDYGRFVNTGLQIAVPLLLRDPVGLAQLVTVAVSTTLVTHALKRTLNNVTVANIRLGQRPSAPNSNQNTPSGHSSMAALAVFFLARRYGLLFLLITLPIMLLTMYARVALDAHTLTGALSGGLIGLLMAALFTSRRQAGVRAINFRPYSKQALTR